MQESGLSLMQAELWPILLKIANFRYHGNRGRSEKNLTHSIKLPDPYNSLLDASIWVIYCATQFIAHFYVQVSKFSLLWQQGSQHGLTLTMKSVDPLIPLVGASIRAISLTLADLWLI